MWRHITRARAWLRREFNVSPVRRNQTLLVGMVLFLMTATTANTVLLLAVVGENTSAEAIDAAGSLMNVGAVASTLFLVLWSIEFGVSSSPGPEPRGEAPTTDD